MCFTRCGACTPGDSFLTMNTQELSCAALIAVQAIAVHADLSALTPHTCRSGRLLSPKIEFIMEVQRLLPMVAAPRAGIAGAGIAALKLCIQDAAAVRCFLSCSQCRHCPLQACHTPSAHAQLHSDVCVSLKDHEHCVTVQSHQEVVQMPDPGCYSCRSTSLRTRTQLCLQHCPALASSSARRCSCQGRWQYLRAGTLTRFPSSAC